MNQVVSPVHTYSETFVKTWPINTSYNVRKSVTNLAKVSYIIKSLSVTSKTVLTSYVI